MSVQKGNTIHVDEDKIGANKIRIQWSQSLQTRSQEYYCATFTNKSNGSSEENLFFVQADKLNELKNKSSGGSYDFVVDDSWQYGQRKDGNKRFLVYQNKDQKMYQHRFVENAVTQLGGKLGQLAPALGSANEVTKAFVGDYMKNF